MSREDTVDFSRLPQLQPTLFTSTAQQVNRTCMKSLFEPSSFIGTNYFITENGGGWDFHA